MPWHTCIHTDVHAYGETFQHIHTPCARVSYAPLYDKDGIVRFHNIFALSSAISRKYTVYQKADIPPYIKLFQTPIRPLFLVLYTRQTSKHTATFHQTQCICTQK